MPATGAWRSLAAACALLAIPASSALAQAAATFGAGAARMSVAVQMAGSSSSRSGAAATSASPASRSSLALEALGGIAGAALGTGVVLLASECGVDDLACEIVTVSVAGAAGVLGAALGTTLVARQTGARHSTVGAALGAVLGTGVGLGVHYLLNRNSDRNLGDAVVVPIFAISQGLFAAILGHR